MITNSLPITNRRAAVAARLVLGIFALVISLRAADASEVEGFTEPYRSIDVAAEDSGVVMDVLVHEGDKVQIGQPLVRLTTDVQKKAVALARQHMEMTGRIESAAAELNLRKDRLQKLSSLRRTGHARQEEVDRAEAEVAVAQANVKTAHEEQTLRRLEYQRVKAQLARRTVRSPINGVVTLLHKDEGEFVAPNDPQILTVVQLDPLLARFSVNTAAVERLKIGQRLDVRFPATTARALGVVEHVSPVTDAESGTVQVKIRFDNPEGVFRSGERCVIQF